MQATVLEIWASEYELVIQFVINEIALNGPFVLIRDERPM